jgi:hypothetical protein
MAVTFDAKGTTDATANGATALNFTNLTITGGLSNSALVAQLAFSLKTISNLTVTWDNGGSNQAMTQIIAANGTGSVCRAELWGLVNPISGNKTLRSAWTGSSDVCVQAVSWSNVDQTGGTTTFANATSATGSSSGTGTHNTITITSAVGNATMDSATGTPTYNSVNQTSTYIDNTPATISAAGSRAAGAATVTHAWNATSTPSEAWVSVGVDIVAGGAAAAQNRILFGYNYDGMGGGRHGGNRMG